MDKTQKIVVELLAEICGTKKVQQDLTIDLFQKGYLDSMGVVELLTELEDRFDVEIPLETFNPDDFKTAEKIIRFVQDSLKQ